MYIHICEHMYKNNTPGNSLYIYIYICRKFSSCLYIYIYTRESQKLSALLFFQFIYTNVGLNKYVIFLHSLLPFRCTWLYIYAVNFLLAYIYIYIYIYTRESKKLSALLFFQFIYTNVGLNKYVIFLHSLLPFRCTWSSGPQACVFPPRRRFLVGRATIYAPLSAVLCP